MVAAMTGKPGWLLSVALVAAAAPAGGERVASTAELRAALAKAKPGATLLLAPGDYEGFAVQEVRGAEGKPIVVRAEDPKAPPRFTGGVQLSDCEWLELDGLLFEGIAGNGLNVDDAGSFETPARGIVLRRLVVRDCGGKGNDDGIKLSGVSGFEVIDCTIERWGRGGSAIDCVGCKEGVIEGCTFRDMAEGEAASGVQLKGGTRSVTVRRCTFENAGQRAVNLGGSTGRDYFRPKPEGFEAKDLVVERCTFIGSMSPVAFVGVDGARVRFNTFFMPRKWVMRILQETTADDFVPCRRGEFTDNLVVYRGAEVAIAVNVGPKTEPASFTFARNYWYCADAPARSKPQLPVAEKDGAGGEDPLLKDPEQGDFDVAPKSPAKQHGAHAPVKPSK
jgi:hypothetical protein